MKLFLCNRRYINNFRRNPNTIEWGGDTKDEIKKNINGFNNYYNNF